MIKRIIFVFTILSIFLFPPQVSAKHIPGVEYDLPFPGLLPDHPAYIIKSIRDNIEEFLISDPLENAGYNLSKADVRVSAALALVDQKNNTALALETVSVAENYFQASFESAKEAKAQGVDIVDISKRLNQAKNKYLEIINKIEAKTDGKDNKTTESLIKKLDNFNPEIKT